MKIFKSFFLIVFSLSVMIMGAAPAFAYEDSPLKNWVVQEYNDTNGLPTGEANTVLQASDGYIWIGSYGGLIRYDGTTFRNYSESGGIASSSIRALFEDSKGRLWIGTNDMGVYLFENNTFSLYTHEDKNLFLSVRCFSEGKDGTIYVGTTSGLAKVGDGKLEKVNDRVFGMTVYNVPADKNGVLWACLDDGIAELIKDDEVIFTFESSKYLKSDLYSAVSDAQGNIYIGTGDNYIYKVDFKNADYSADSFSLTEYSTGGISTYNDMCADENGNIWGAAINGIGYVDSDGDWHTVNVEHASAANRIILDYEGNIWIASTSYGVIHLVNGLYSTPNIAAGLVSTSLNAVAAGSDGNYYIGTDTGLIVLDKNYSPVENELTEMLEGDRVRNILCDSRGVLWIGTYYNNGLVMYENKRGENRITSISAEDGLSSAQIRHIIELSNGDIAVSTQSGVNIIRDGKVYRTYTEEDGLTYPVILSLCEGADGTLYAGSDGQGIYALKDGKVTHYSFDEGLSSGVVLRMVLDDDGSGMFISAGNSLFYWDFSTFTLLNNYSKSAGSIFDMTLVDDEIWLMQSNGINVLNKEKLLSGEETPVNILGSSFGLTGSLNANTWNDMHDGVLYLCTANGLSILDLDSLNEEDTDISVVVNQVAADDNVYELPQRIDVSGDTTRLTFYFAPLSFSGKDVYVRYQLVGFDDKAYTLLNDREMSASYTNLSGGNYDFRLEVLGSDRQTVIHSLSIPVHKNYLPWERPWFWLTIAVVFVLLVLIVIVAVIHAKTKRLKRRQQEYRDIIGQAMRTFANTIDAKDRYTKGHSERVARYTLEIAKKLKMSEDEQERIYYIALLHDIGKIGIPDYILNKPGKLTPEERRLIMQHPTMGGEILKDFTSLPGISDGARYHHERYDGKGYNEGLKGDEIPFFARIICVADSYDAMSSVRCYQGNMDPDAIVEELKEGSGTQFDPKIVDVMLELIKEGKAPCMDLLPKPDDPADMFK